jgi:3-dehydroquinate dehydratase type I
VICVTGAERDVGALRQRIEADDAFHEIRADALDTHDGLLELVRQHGSRVLVCHRPARQGGGYDGDETARLALLRDALDAGARYVDVEDDVAHDFDCSRVVMSWHDFGGRADDLVARAKAMRPRCAVVKLAVHVDDAAELEQLRRVRDAIDGDVVLIGMGAAGLLSRTHYQRFGSRWTYVAADPALATAPGQLDLATATAMNMPASSGAPFVALIGGEQVMFSPGPEVYNALFRQRGLTMSYLSIISTSLERCLPMLTSLGAIGLSVTMPLKSEANDFAIDQTLGAVNSLKRTGDTWHGINTDICGVREPLRDAEAKGRVLILGAGGAARAAAVACRELELDVTLSARKREQAEALVRSMGQSVAAIDWNARGGFGADVLINATAVSGDDTPWPNDVMPPLVFDLAISPRSRLLEDTRAFGSRAIDAMQMWIHQGAEQMRFILGDDVTATELSALLP